MSHRRSFSARLEPDRLRASQFRHDGPPSLRPPLSPIPDVSSFATWGEDVGLPLRKLRALWYRACFLALFSLAAVSVYVVFVAPPSLGPIPPVGVDQADTLPASHGSSRWSSPVLAAIRHRRPKKLGLPPQIALNATQELACLSSFIASLPQNVVPSTVDTSKPTDPQLILDFDTRGPHAKEEVEAIVQDVWLRNPVMLYSKVRVRLLVSYCARK